MFTWLLGIYIGMCIGYGQLETNLWALLMTPLIFWFRFFITPILYFRSLGSLGFGRYHSISTPVAHELHCSYWHWEQPPYQAMC